MQLPFLAAAVACTVGYLFVRELYLRQRINPMLALVIIFAFLLAAPMLALFSVTPTGVPIYMLAVAAAGSALAAWGTYMTKTLLARKQRR